MAAERTADAASAEELAANILAFQEAYEVMAEPFEWKFTRRPQGAAQTTRSQGSLRAEEGRVNTGPNL